MSDSKAIETVVQVGDAISLTVLFGYFIAALPTLAVLFTVIWTGIRIYETDTFQQFIRRGIRITKDDNEPSE